ncbi:MAG: HEAT repeat domain-containing protein, partial [Candidatus Eremiobacteraeota bacterium]|nr:HEAT repeat domain-containing protein [Candidatus Eremiobacteraeota bacterium]
LKPNFFQESVSNLLTCSDPTAGPVFLQALNDPSHRVRSIACISIGNISYKPAIPVLKRLISDPEPDVRASACCALGEMDDTASEHELLKAATDNEVNVRYEAARALLRIGNPKGCLVLEEMLAKKESPWYLKQRDFFKEVRHVLKGDGK